MPPREIWDRAAVPISPPARRTPEWAVLRTPYVRVYRYIERNPVRAAMTAVAEEYRWSSVHANLGLCHDPLITPHAAYVALGADCSTRCAAYRDWLRDVTDADELLAIRRHIEQQRAYGDARFQSMVEKTLNRPAAVRSRGRPKKLAPGGKEIRT